MEKAGIKDVDKMQEEVKKEIPVQTKEEAKKKLYKFLNFRIISLY